MNKQERLNEILQEKVLRDIQNRSKDFLPVLESLQSREIGDAVIPAEHLSFAANGGLTAEVLEGDLQHSWNLTDHSAYQMAEKLGLPAGWAYKSLHGSEWHRESVSYALNQYIQNVQRKDNRFLFRNVGDKVRGILSTSYKRLNTKDIFLMFLQTAMEMDFVLLDAYEGTSRDYIEVIDPVLRHLRTPNNGVITYARGSMLKNSDFGDGRLDLRSYNLQAMCLNGAVGHTYLREVHLGKRLPENFMFSIETISKETEVRALAVRDALKHMFNPMNTEIEEAQIVDASGTPINVAEEVKRLPRIGMTKDEVKTTEELLLQRKPEDGLVGDPTVWMMAQAISRVAGKDEGIRKRTLQEIAGNMIFTGKHETVEIES